VGNLVLPNPSSPNQTVAALVTAVNLDEQILASTATSASVAALQAEVTALQGVPILAPAKIYSVAGTPLPAPTTALKGATAIVSDATTPTYLAAYVGSGAVMCRVLCNGSAWVTA
jgi:hypothetical protein